MSRYRLALADPSHIAEIRAMQAASFRGLGRVFYPQPIVESFLRAPGTLDDEVVGEGHYFVVRDERGRIVGSGGWSQRQPGYSSLGIARPIGGETAIVRSVFVHPDHARRGMGSAIMAEIEGDAAAAGIATLDLTATLSGVPLYRNLGYRVVRRRPIKLPHGGLFDVADMTKSTLAVGKPISKAA